MDTHTATNAELEARFHAAKEEIETLKATIELHRDGIRRCEKRWDDLINLKDDILNEQMYRDSKECKAGLTYSEWNRIQIYGGRI